MAAFISLDMIGEVLVRGVWCERQGFFLLLALQSPHSNVGLVLTADHFALAADGETRGDVLPFGFEALLHLESGGVPHTNTLAISCGSQGVAVQLNFVHRGGLGFKSF